MKRLFSVTAIILVLLIGPLSPCGLLSPLFCSSVLAAFSPSTEVGTAVIYVNYGTVGVTAAQLAASRENRRSILVQNLSTANVYVGADSTVTTSTGIKLPPNASVTIYTTQAVWAIADAAASNVRYMEEYNV